MSLIPAVNQDLPQVREPGEMSVSCPICFGPMRFVDENHEFYLFDCDNCGYKQEESIYA